MLSRILSRILYVFIVGISLSYCGTPPNRGLIELRISTNDLKISYLQESMSKPCKNSCAELKYELINTTQNDIMLYDFKRYLMLGRREEALNCDSTWSAMGTTLYVLYEDKSLKPAIIHIPDSIHNKLNILERQISMAKIWYRKSRVIVRRGETAEFKQEIDFREYDFQPGTYFVKLIYYHPELSPDVTLEEVSEDSGEGVYLFNGCLQSNLVKLIVY